MRYASESLSDYPFAIVLMYVSPRDGLSTSGGTYKTEDECKNFLEEMSKKFKVTQYKIYTSR